MSGDGDLASVVGEVYAAVLDPACWDRAVAAVAAYLGGVGATLEIHDRRSRQLAFFSSVGMPEDGVADYVAYYHSVCPRLPWGRDLAPGTPFYDHMFLTEAEMSRLEFYEDFLARDGFRTMLGGTIENDDARIAIVAVHRLAASGHPGAEEVERCRRVLVHLRRALAIQQEMERSAGRAAALEAWVADLAVGVIGLDAAGEVATANGEAIRIGAAGRGLTLGARLEATEPRERRRIERLIAGAIAQVPLAGIESVGRPPISVAAVPLASRRSSALPLPLGAEPLAAAVYLTDSTRHPAIGRQVLVRGFGLTGAEADLAVALARGATISSYAASRSVSRNTVRTQLARLRHKLGVASQLELVRLLLALFPPLAPGVIQLDDDASSSSG